MNQLYDDCRERMLEATLNWTAMDCVLLAYRGAYVFDATDLTQDDVGAPVSVSGVLTHPVVVSGGYARTDNGVFTEIPIGAPITFLVLAEDDPTPGDRRLLAYMNVAQSMPFTPNGLDWVVAPNWADSRGWFRC